MADSPADAAVVYEAIKIIGAMVGTGGATAIVVAWLGSRRPKPPDAAPAAPASIGIQALLADHMAMQALTAEIKRLADAAEDMVKTGNRLADMMDIASAVERLTSGRK